MPLELGGLTRDAVFSPETNLLAQAMPNKLAGHELPCGTHRGMRKTMDQIKTLRLQPSGTMGLGWPVEVSQRSVTPFGPTKRNVLQLETGDGRMVSLNIRVVLLTGSHGSIINPFIDGGSCESVSNMVVLALDVPDIRGVFGDICKVSLLPA